MYSFKNDYSEGAHSNILNALITTNLNQEDGYGLDTHTSNAISSIKNLLNNDNVDIHFLSGGTQTNLLSISSFLRPHHACISAYTGHISSNETGAIESTGHKVITIDSIDGKLRPIDIKTVLDSHKDEHHVKPKLVYISNPTELGTIYKKEELKSLSEFCTSNNIILYLDGARLGSALTCDDNDMTLEDICNFTDAFFIGGTKNGALLGEALIIKKDDLKEDFRYYTKQKGALLAKGRLLGIQFEELFKNDLFFELARHANKMASILTSELKAAKIEFLIDSPSNQIFPILDHALISKLEKKFHFYIWKQIDSNRSAIRMVTSWATKEEAVLEFLNEIK